MLTLLDEHVAEVKKNSRPAGFVLNPQPILPDPTSIPTLAEYRKEPKP
jgi:hypothetical protein